MLVYRRVIHPDLRHGGSFSSSVGFWSIGSLGENEKSQGKATSSGTCYVVQYNILWVGPQRLPERKGDSTTTWGPYSQTGAALRPELWFS